MDTNRTRRHNRIRAKITGTPERPRLCIYKSNRYLEAQIIDDTVGETLVSTSDFSMKKELEKKTNEEKVRLIGLDLIKKAKAKKIDVVVFDRGGFPYVGNIKKLATVIREGGIKF